MPILPEMRVPLLLCVPALALLAPLAAAGATTAPAKPAIVAAVETAVRSGSERFDNSVWNRMLAEGTRDNLVDYNFMREHRDRLDAYLKTVGGAALERLAPAQVEALLISAYNACTVQSILDSPGRGSIREIPGVWSTIPHTVGGFDVTLDTIEHDVLRPIFRDPRLHFVLSCAALSCAPLPPWAIDGDRIDAQLEERAKVFLADSRNVRVEEDTLLLPRYFDWYTADFVTKGWRGAARTVPAYVARYATPAVADFIKRNGNKPPIKYLPYDWLLNDAPYLPQATPTP